ncbi:PspC domain-containing protein [Microbacterium sp. W1N]|uniref:PspC domain-containing protein n=1 Tax=Microbacterium festucae TaxID=2977531 RepID=UPI0021C209D2|nr:PspC domain-containing protein [Microbacterium festucae]MCT9818931.1 PspC domain-containing protein [Microbacterium festucae]
MTDTPVLDPGPPPSAPSSAPSWRPSRSDRFFAWTAGLGLVRGDGWIGGVAAGVAARLRIDPLIVRGILVVTGLFGFPVLFLYAVAWALLPDLESRIPLQEALRGRFVAAHVGILAFLLLGVLPAPAALFVGAPTWWSFAGGGGVYTALSIIGILIAIGIGGGLLFLIVRAAQGAGHPASETAPRTASAAASDASAPPAASGAAEPADAAGTDAAGFAASVPPLSPLPSDDGRPSDEVGRAPADAAPTDEAALTEAAPTDEALTEAATEAATPADEMAAWREQHAAWKVQEDAWRREQQNLARIARDQARRERHAHAAAFTAEAAERRRIRRLTAPRTPFAYVAAAVGLAVLAGTLSALASASELAVAQGVFWGALVLAAAMVVAGLLRWRSGFLAFLTMLALAGGLVATAVPTVQAMHVGDYGISNLAGAETYPAGAPFVQPWGDLTVYLGDTGTSRPMHVEKRMGTTRIAVEPGVEVTIDATTTHQSAIYLIDAAGDYRVLSAEPGTQREVLADGRTRYVATIAGTAAPITTRQTIVLEQEVGPIDIRLLQPNATDASTTEGETP